MHTDIFGNLVSDAPHPKGNQLQGRNKSGGYIENPMHLVFGKNENEKCKNCIHLIRKRFAKTYYKCELRNNVDKCSPESDHRFNWFACGKFDNGKNT